MSLSFRPPFREIISLVFLFFLVHSSFATGENDVVKEDVSNSKSKRIILPPIVFPPIFLPPIIPPPILPPPILPLPILPPPIIRPPFLPFSKQNRSIFLPPFPPPPPFFPPPPPPFLPPPPPLFLPPPPPPIFLPPIFPPPPPPGSPCGGNANNPNEGVCVLGGTCRLRGGTTIGRCPGAPADCCAFTEQCGYYRTLVDVSQPVTKLLSSEQCTFRFRKEPNICQIRLDFNAFQLTSADAQGSCVSDYFRIYNSVTVANGFTTCGTFTSRQHMYLSFGSKNTIEISSILRNAFSRYEILATKIPCNSVNRAPDYCLQYFTKLTDIVQSFDFPRQQQNNQQYTVCVKPSGQSTQVEWKPCIGLGNQFSITGPTVLPETTCNTDWVQVKGKQRNCESFPLTTSSWKPYELIVNFDGGEFPPPPVGYNMPIPVGGCSPINCPASAAGPVDCLCIGATQAEAICQCNIAGANPMSPTPDFNNTGFCLEYTQQ